MRHQSKNNKLIMKKILIFTLLLFFITVLPIFAKAVTFKPSAPSLFGGKSLIHINGSTLGTLIVHIYNWSIGAIAFLAVIMIMVSGLQWMLAAGSAPQINAAKDRISSALIGLVLALGAYFILDFINPQAVSFKNLSPNTINKVELPKSCDINGGEIQLSSGAKSTAEQTCADTCIAGGYTLRNSGEEGDGPWCCKCLGCPTGTVKLPTEYEDKGCWSYCRSQGKTGGSYSDAYPQCCQCNGN